MLRELSVQNLALIEDVRVELRPGFCAWTGETGAGKSLLLGALGLLLGERASTDLLRSGAEELRVTGVFELSHPDLKRRIAALLNTDPDALENQLLLARRVHRSGRSGAYINDQPVALATLRAVGSLLVDIHGQRESAALLDPSYQLDLLDAFGNLHDYKACYIEKAERLRLARKRWAELAAAREQRQRELSLVRFEREELDQARLEPGEREELTRERDRLANAQQLQAFAHTAYALLYEDEGSVHERIGRVQRDAESWADLDPELTETVTHLDGLLTQVKDVAQTLRRLGERWEADPERLAEVESRLQLLKKLESKYRKSIDELILYRLSLDDQESRLQAAEDDLSALEGEIQSLLQQTRDAALDLSRQRHKVAKKLAAEVEKQLADLGMPEAKLGTELTTKQLTLDDIPATGIDHLELTLAANPGEPARPLRKVASGGEMSRTMLALKTVLAKHDHTATLVFDEIDANVGGRLGDVLGSKLAALGRSHQVICVTHLAPVASYAKHHWTIRKTKIKNRTVTQITPLQDEEQRLEELASMLRGESRTDSTRHEVQQMLQSARAAW
jgi:DNA repair protein RecN (Recombination protein N)